MERAIPPLELHALVPAAGRGERFAAGDLPKQFLTVAGRPLLAWTLERLLASGVGSVTVAVPEPLLARVPDLVGDDARVRWIAGGPTRQQTVALCLAASGAATGDAAGVGAETLVLVHDGARPAVSPDDVRATVEAARGADGAVLGRLVGDTLKRLSGDRILETVDRRSLFRAETPQVFPAATLAAALETALRDRFEGTDEASLVERLPDTRIVAVPASHANPKLTRPSDLPLIEALLATSS